MKHLTCNDSSPEGAPNCDFVAHGETDEAVVNAMRAHAGEMHMDLMKDATPESMAMWDKMIPSKITQD